MHARLQKHKRWKSMQRRPNVRFKRAPFCLALCRQGYSRAGRSVEVKMPGKKHWGLSLAQILIERTKASGRPRCA